MKSMLDHPRLRHLSPHERNVLAEFLSRLREQFGARIAHVWLFGSKARGDSDAESDIDLLIVTRDGDDALAKAVGEIAYALNLEHGVLLCEYVVSAWRFAQMRARQELIYKNIMSEGVDLWLSVVEPLNVTEERAVYDAGLDEDYGTYEDYLRERLEQAYEDLADAHRALDVGSHRLALNRAYYAVFHISTVALALLGQERHKHSAVESAFHEYLIKPGYIEPEFGVFYKEAREWRERADYRFNVKFTVEKTREVLEKAERVVARLERFLRERGLLKEDAEG